MFLSFSWLCPPPAVGREVNGFLDPQVGSAPADVAIHRRVDLRAGRLGDFYEKSRRRHELTGLTIAALRHVELLPGALQWMRAVGGQALDGGDLFRADCRQLRLARPDGVAVDLHRAGAALADPAAELRAL